MNIRIRVLKRISRYQFGVDIIPEGAEVVVSRTGKPRFVLYNDERYAGVNAKTTHITLYLPAGRRLFELTKRRRVYVKDPKYLITDLFSGHVEDADEGIRAGDEVVIVYDEEVLAVGKARISGRSMKEFSRGVAVRIREKITNASRTSRRA